MKRVDKSGEPLTCSVERCFDDVYALGLCQMHYQRQRKQSPPQKRAAFDPAAPCAVVGCDRRNVTRGLCGLHYNRFRVYGDPLHVPHSARRFERVIPPDLGPADLAKVLGVSRQRADQILNPNAHKARAAVQDAVNSGRLVKPSRCERCLTETAKLHAHHWDYHPNAALDVRWLCGACHGAVHVHLREIGLKPPYQFRTNNSRKSKDETVG
jgi:hypothetical protein